MFIVPKAGILIPILPEKSEEYFTQQATAHSLLNTTGNSKWQERSYVIHFPLWWRNEQKRPLTFHPDQNNACKFVSSPLPIMFLASLQTS